MTKSLLALRHVAFEDLGVLEPFLRERGFQVHYLDVGVDPFDAGTLREPDLLVVLGGPIGVYDDAAYPVLADEVAALRSRLHAGAPTLGICLGAQLMALALGAQVSPSGRKEIGYGPLTLTDAGRASALAPLDGVPVLHWHGDTFEIPDGAARLASTPGFPNQAFSSGPAMLGLQFHLEADPDRIEQWLIGHANELAGAGIDPGTIRADAAQHGPALRALAGEVVGAWLAGAFG